MRLLFAHDHIFETDSSGRYFSEKLPYSVWKRYLCHFSSVTVVARNHHRIHSTKSLSDGDGVFLNPLPSLSSLRGLLYNRNEVQKIIAESISGVDAVIVRLPSEIGLSAFHIAKQLNKPTLVEMVGCPWDSLWNYGSIKGKIYAPIAFYRNRSAIRQATHVMYVTENFLQRRYPTTGSSVGVSDVQIPSTSPSVLSRRLGRPFTKHNPIRIGFIGNLIHYKGIQTLLKAGVILKNRMHPIRLLFLGGGNVDPWKAQATRLGISNLSDFVGTLPAGNKVFEWLDSLDLYVQPSLVEGLPRATLEAMSRGCPVVASRVGGIPELLSSDNLFTPGDANDLAEQIERMIIDSNYRVESSRTNFQKAREYTQDILEQKRNSFLREFYLFAKNL